MKRIFEVHPWNVVSHESRPDDKRLQESMTSLGNGYMGARGFFDEEYSGDTLPGVYLAGVWFPDKTRVGWWKNGYPKYFGKAINAVNFLGLGVVVNGHAVDLAKDAVNDYTLDLDMRHGVLTRSFVIGLDDATLRLTFERFFSAVQDELCVQRVTIDNLGRAPVDAVLRSAIDADVHNEDANYDERFWEVVGRDAGDASVSLLAITKENRFGTPRFLVGAQTRVVTTLDQVSTEDHELEVAVRFQGTIAPGATARLEKRTVVVTSRDYAGREELLTGLRELSEKVATQSYEDLLGAHTAEWAHRWESADVTIEGDTPAQQGIRFNLFQLFSTYYGKDPRLNIGPKGFTGEKYGGATYWDTEAFAVPVYLGIADPTVTRSLLQYRYDQLDGAHVNAEEQGLAGALFPMVTFNGIECHNEWEITFEEIHRNGDIAFAIYNYTKYTGDTSYVLHEGSTVLTEISRFWADRVHFSKRRGKYVIHGVTGADEYENNVDNNWYTNYLAQWTLRYTLEILDQVDPAQAALLAVDAEERATWRDIVARMYLPHDEKLGIFVQHDGFLDKDLEPVSAIPAGERPINQHWSWDKILRSPYIKQADVLQAVWYFIDEFTVDEKKRNFDFYEPLTVHESSLSASIHSILAADLHYEDKAVEMYERTARLDLDNYNNDTNDGLHITSMTGGWLAIVQGFAGMRVRDGRLRFAPFLPKRWQQYRFRQLFRGRLIEVTVNESGTSLALLHGEPITVELHGEPVELTA